MTGPLTNQDQPFGFRCSTCGLWHEGLPLDWAVDLPDLGLPREEQAQRLWTDGDFCVVDGKEFFIRGCLEIPVHEGPGPLVYGVWTSLSEKSFRRARELQRGDPPPGEPPWFGWFANRLAGYPDTFLLKSLVHPRPGGLRPTIELEPTDHPLAGEQRDGISSQRLIEIVQGLLHAVEKP